MNKEQTVLITGADGLVGTALVQQLIKLNYSRIICHTRTPKSFSDPRIINTFGDLRDISILDDYIKKVDCLIHLAGLVSYNSNDAFNLLRDNHILTRDIVNTCLHSGVRKLIFLSSASTMTRSSDPFFISEEAQGRTVFHSHYAKSKYLAELEIHRAQAEGMNCTILNPCLILGEGDWSKSSMYLLKRISKGLKFYPQGNLGITDLNYVVQNIIQCIDNQPNIGPYLLYQTTISYKDLIRMVSNLIKIDAPTRSLNYPLARIFSIFETFRNFFTGSKNIITSETAFLSSHTFTYSVRNLIPNLPNTDFELESLVLRSIKANI